MVWRRFWRFAGRGEVDRSRTEASWRVLGFIARGSCCVSSELYFLGARFFRRFVCDLLWASFLSTARRHLFRFIGDSMFLPVWYRVQLRTVGIHSRVESRSIFLHSEIYFHREFRSDKKCQCSEEQ